MEYNPEVAAKDARRISDSFTITSIPMDIYALAASLGLTIKHAPLDNNISGYLKEHNGNWEIGVNSLHHPNRQRFTIAHELGHYFLHRDKAPFEDGLLFRKDNQQNPLEREANQFASLLLMPSLEFKRALKDQSVLEAAKMFGVSEQAAMYRLQYISNEVPID
jgi:Zn-dependent peptidase ImmA (M78 family)